MALTVKEWGYEKRIIMLKENNLVSPENILDYIYAVLHSPTYRETYKEFLKIDFPRVPFTDSQEIFWKMSELWYRLRQLHLMEDISRADLTTGYLGNGDNTVGTINAKSYDLIPALSSQEREKIGRVIINDTQYFDNVPLVAWEFYIWWYQPAQKRLKDRKDTTLSYEDVTHYQKIIHILTKTSEIMGEIDEIWSSM